LKKNILIKSLQVLLIRGFGAASSFLLTLTVTNTANVSDAGLFLFCFAIINFFGLMLTVGSPQALIRIVGSNYDSNWSTINHQFSVILKLVVGLCLVCSAVFYGFNHAISTSMFDKPLLAELLPLAGLAILFFALTQVFASAFQGKHYPILASTIQNVIVPVCFIAGIGLFVLFDGFPSTINMIWLYTGGLGLSALTGMYIWQYDRRAKISYKKGFPLELRDSLYPLALVAVMSVCVEWVGQFAVATYLEAEQIAYFAAAQRTALLASFVLLAVNLVVAPKFANAFSKGNLKKVNKLSLLSSRLMLLLATPMLLLMILLPESIMGLFGKEYKVAAPLLQIMAVGQFINVITGSVGYLLTMTKHEKDFKNVVLFTAPLAIVLAFVLTKEYGLLGAAYATSISVGTQNLLAVCMVKKRLGFNTLNIFRRIN